MFVPQWVIVVVITYVAVSLMSFYVWLPSEDDCARAIALRAERDSVKPNDREPTPGLEAAENKCIEWQMRQ